MIVAVTGPRPHKLGIGPGAQHSLLVRRIAFAFSELQASHLLSGMARGVDQWSAWIAVREAMPFTAVIPFKGQESAWLPEQREKYRELLNLATTRTTLFAEPTSKADAVYKLNKRNEWMVDRCDVLLAVIWPGYQGGTANCVKYAEKVGRKIVRIDPREI